MSCLYSTMSLTLVREWYTIRIIYCYYFCPHHLSFQTSYPPFGPCFWTKYVHPSFWPSTFLALYLDKVCSSIFLAIQLSGRLLDKVCSWALSSHLLGQSMFTHSSNRSLFNRVPVEQTADVPFVHTPQTEVCSTEFLRNKQLMCRLYTLLKQKFVQQSSCGTNSWCAVCTHSSNRSLFNRVPVEQTADVPFVHTPQTEVCSTEFLWNKQLMCYGTNSPFRRVHKHKLFILCQGPQVQLQIIAASCNFVNVSWPSFLSHLPPGGVPRIQVCVWGGGGGFLEKLLFGKHKTLYNEQYNNNCQQKKKCTPSPFPTHNIQVSPANNLVISKVFSFKPGTGHNIAIYALPATNSAYFLPSFFIQRFQFLFQFFFNIK